MTPPPLDVPVLDEGERISRADLVFYGVDHSGPSYEARVFVDAPDADESTTLDAEAGYVGSFTVFGHDGCYGDEGHCLPDQRETDEFDHRPPHPLHPWTKTVIGNEALIGAIENPSTSEVTVTVVAVPAARKDGDGDGDSPLRFDSVRILAYED